MFGSKRCLQLGQSISGWVASNAAIVFSYGPGALAAFSAGSALRQLGHSIGARKIGCWQFGQTRAKSRSQPGQIGVEDHSSIEEAGHLK